MSAVSSRPGLLGLLLAGGWLAGCAPAVLRVEDTAALPGRETVFTAYLERPAMFGFGNDLERVPVQFWVGGRCIGEAKTKEGGLASHRWRLDSDEIRQFEVRASVDGQTLEGRGAIFAWRPERPAIAVDVDHTISQTDVESLIGDVDLSAPIAGARETLVALADEFSIVYVTARSRSFLDKTHAWLRQHGFPDGPVIPAPRVRDMIEREKYKRRRLAELQARWPNLRIGISNTEGDIEAYAINGMLPLLVRPKSQKRYPVRAVVLANWQAAATFFAANREALREPERLEAVLRGERMLLQALPSWVED